MRTARQAAEEYCRNGIVISVEGIERLLEADRAEMRADQEALLNLAVAAANEGARIQLAKKRAAVLEEVAAFIENECECEHGVSIYGVAERIRALASPTKETR